MIYVFDMYLICNIYVLYKTEVKQRKDRGRILVNGITVINPVIKDKGIGFSTCHCQR